MLMGTEMNVNPSPYLMYLILRVSKHAEPAQYICFVSCVYLVLDLSSLRRVNEKSRK